MQRSRRLKLAQEYILRRGLPVASSLLAAVPVAYAQQAETTAGGLEEIIVTAQKREESLQNVPVSIQAIGSERLEQLQVKEFADYVKYMPSVSFTTLGPGFSLPYFRGVASGENNNHSGPQPSVGMYLDEQPITTIQGALDIHMYDIARVEALAGPQGTLYGASSQAGTIRIITNKPDPSGFRAGYGVEGNTVTDGGNGYVAEGFVNLPITDIAAVRLVAWARHDAGWIDSVPGERTYTGSGACVTNDPNSTSGCALGTERPGKDYNDVDTYGARAALRVELNDNWTITPQVMGQYQEANGSFAYDPSVGEHELTHFNNDYSEDKWVQAALTVEGKIGNFDLVYAGAYLKREDIVDADYSDYTFHYDNSNPYYTSYYWGDSAGAPLADPSQFINGSDDYKRQSHEIRLSSPTDNRFRFVAGLFYQDQEHKIFQNYQIKGLGGYTDGTDFFPIVVPGWTDTIWLTNQLREDSDSAVFGEISFDLTEQLTATAGIRYYQTENSILGFFGYGPNYSSNYGVVKCEDYPQPEKQYNGSPCTNINDEVDDDGNVPKFNVTYRFTDDKLMYVTYSEGFRPGGINRNNTVPPYKPDYLKNYELGWKTTWADNTLRFNGAIFHEDWDNIQYSFLPPSGSGLTVIRNAGAAVIDGIEADLTWAATEALTFSGGFSWLDAKLDEDYVPDPEAPPEAFKGDRLPVTPEFKANLTARYEFQMGSTAGHLQAGYVYNGTTYSDLTRADRDNFGQNDAYTIVDLSGGLRWGGISVEMYVNNVFDELARYSAFAGCTTSVCGVQPYYVTNAPRTIGLKFSQEF